MKVLIVANYNPGHFSPFVLEQVESLKKLGIEFDFFGIVGKGIFGYLKNLPALTRKINEYKPDLIHAHYGLSGMLATLQMEVPVVITFHNGETLSSIPNMLSSIAAKRAKWGIYVAQHIRDLSYMKSNRFSIIPCGVDPNVCVPMDKLDARQHLGLKPNRKYILFGGAFDNLRKNYPLLKSAIELLPTKDNIECIEMKGMTRKQCVLYMNACDVFVLPTKSEGSPQALKEAMACNCPIVGTDVADIRHLLGNVLGHFICTFDPKDVADKLSAALSFIGRTNGRIRIFELNLTNEQVAQRVKEVYDKVLSKKNLITPPKNNILYINRLRVA